MAGLALLPAPTRSSAQMRNRSAKAGRFNDQVASEPPSPCTKTTCGALTGPAIRQWVTMPATSTSFSSTSPPEAALASSAARSTSSRPIMPPGPVPATVARLTPSSCAKRRAAGEALGRPPALTGVRAGTRTPATAALPAGCCPLNDSAFCRLISASSRISAATCSSDRSSPGATITAREAPTGAFCPCGTSSQRRIPVAGASTSFVAFSLSISTRGSPCRTASPGCFSHSTTSPVFIASPHLGILTIVATLPLLSSTFCSGRPLRSRRPPRENLSQDFLNGGNNALRTGNVELLQRRAEWYRRMGRCYPLNWRIEFSKSFLDNQRGNICCGTAPWIVLVNNHEAVRLSDRGQNRFLVQWGKGAWINNLYRNVIGLQHIRRRERLVNHARDCHNCDISPFAFDVGFAQRDHILALWHLAIHGVEHLVLEKHDQIIIANSGCQQPLGVRRSRGDDRFDARHVGEYGIVAAGMLTGCAHARADHRADDQWATCLATKHIAQLGPLVEDLIHADAEEIDKHQFRYGTQTGGSRADRCANEPCLGNGSVKHTVAPELLN